MRKTIFTLLTAAMVILPFVSIAEAVESSSDQKCTTGFQWGLQIYGNDYRQTFKPSVDRLTSIDLHLNGDGLWSNAFIDIYKGTNFVVRSEIVQEPDGAGIANFPFSGTFSLMTEQEYTIIPRLSGRNTSLFWYASSSCGYDRGHALSGGKSLSYDFKFETYGYESTSGGDGEGEEPAGGGEGEAPAGGGTEPANQGESQSPSSSNSNEVAPAPNAETSVAISVPDNLTASTWNETVTLRWDASSIEDIDGYNVYRSVKEDEGFESLAFVDKDTFTFTDESVINSVKYYYLVRAFKAEVESESSDTINIVAADVNIIGTGGFNNLIDMYNALSLAQKLLFLMGLIVSLGLLIYLGNIVHNNINNTGSKKKT